MTLIDHIQYLITRHDCVVVAGLGAFVAQNMPARVSADGLTLLPPGRMLVFNNVISHDDGLLSGSVARREGISYEQAREEIAQSVELLRRRIQSEGFVDLPRIGRLEPTDGAAIAFTPAASDSIVDMMYRGLPSVDISYVSEQQPAAELQLLEVDVTSGRRSFASRLKSVGRYAAIVALILAAGATLTTPVLVDDSNVDRASLSLPRVTPARKVVIPASAPRHEQPAAAKEQKESPAAAEQEQEPVVVPVASLKGVNPEKDYECYIIVASCASASEAQRFISQKKAEDQLRVLPSDGRYRVYAAVSNDFDAAFAFKSTDKDFVKRYPSAWVYKTSK